MEYDIQTIITALKDNQEQIYQLPISLHTAISKLSILESEILHTGGGFDYTLYTIILDSVCIAFEYCKVEKELYCYAFPYTQETMDRINDTCRNYDLVADLANTAWDAYVAFQALFEWNSIKSIDELKL